jgi:Ca2+-binding EF-hand superfamily protein
MPVVVNAAKATEEAARALAEAFLTFDSDGDRQLSLSEFRAFLEAAALNPDSAELAFVIFDNDKSGKIDFEEFIEFVAYEALSEDAPRTYFRRAFEAFDADKSGKLDASELGQFL